MCFLLNLNHDDELGRSDLQTRSNNKYITKRVYTQNKIQFVYSSRFFFIQVQRRMIDRSHSFVSNLISDEIAKQKYCGRS